MSAKPTGTFCWADLLPEDQARAIAFYGELVGWTGAVGGEEFGGYGLAFSSPDHGEQAMVAGFNPSIATIRAFQEGAGKAPEEIPAMAPGWTIYLATDDAQATADRVQAAGGHVLQAPMQVGDQGITALCADPTGAAFGLWQGVGHHGFGAFGQPGAFCWTEVHSTDAAVTRDFFAALFGAQSTTMADGPDLTYFQLRVPGSDDLAFGVMQQLPGDAGQPSRFGAYLAVADTDAAVDRATQHGAELVTAPKDTPFGRVAELRDPEGALVKVIRLP